MTKANKRKLLKLAAKAAGIEIKWNSSFPGGGCYMRRVTPEPADPLSKWLPWDPCIDEADSYRLARDLKMNIKFYQRMVGINLNGRFMSWCKWGCGSPSATAEEAIVYTAAAVGRSLEAASTPTQNSTMSMASRRLTGR